MTASLSFIGIDLAWSPNNSTGVAALVPEGNRLRVVECGLRSSDEEIVAFVEEHLAPVSIVMIDAPLIVPNRTGMRTCDKLMHEHFGAQHGGAYPANRTNMRRDRSRPPGKNNVPRGEDLGQLLRDKLKFRWPPPDVGEVARKTGHFVFECYPHPAQLRLFRLEKTLKYKRKRQGIEVARAEFARYLDYVTKLRHPAIKLDPKLVRDLDVAQATGKGYKEREDRLDAIFCVYLAALVPEGRMDCFGKPSEGSIAVPRIAKTQARGCSTP